MMIKLKRLSSALIFSLLIFINTLSSFGQGISVSPSRLFFKGTPGQSVTQAITFANNSTKDMNFIPSLKDWNRDSLGVKTYYASGQLSHSNAEWVALSESTVHLAAGQIKTVNITLHIPRNPESQLTNSMLFFTQIKEQTAATVKKGLGINVLIEIGIQIYHTPAGLAPGNLEFLAFVDRGASTIGDKKVRLMAVKVKNTGKINKDAYVRFELTNKETGKEVTIKPVAIAMLPESEQWIELSLPHDLTGPYLVVAILDAGSQYDLKIAEKEIEY